MNIADAYADPRFNQEVDRRTGYRTRSILCAPVVDVGGRVVAVLQLLNRLDGEPFDEDDERLLGRLRRPGRHRAPQRPADGADRGAAQDLRAAARRHEVVLVRAGGGRPAPQDHGAHLGGAAGRPLARCSWWTGARGEIWSKVAQGDRHGRDPRARSAAASPAPWPPPARRINIPDAYADRASTRRSTGAPATARARSCARRCATAPGAVVGVSQVLNKAGGPFTATTRSLLAALSAQAFIALDNARLFESVVHDEELQREHPARAWPPASSRSTPTARSPASTRPSGGSSAWRDDGRDRRLGVARRPRRQAQRDVRDAAGCLRAQRRGRTPIYELTLRPARRRVGQRQRQRGAPAATARASPSAWSWWPRTSPRSSG